MTREIIRRDLDVRSAAKSAGVFLYEIAETDLYPLYRKQT